MKRYMQHSMITGILLLSMGLGGAALAHKEEVEEETETGVEPDVSLSLALDAASYRLTPADAIEAVLTLAVEDAGPTPGSVERLCLDGEDNDSDAKIDRADADCQVVTSEGVSTNKELYQLRLVFTDPAGQPIVADQIDLLVDELESPPPRVFIAPKGINNEVELLPGEAVETLLREATAPFEPFALTVALADARTEYTFTQAGFYSVRARIPYRQYDPDKVFVVGTQEVAPLGARDFGGMLISNTVEFALVADADGDGYCFPIPHAGMSCNPEPDCDDGDPLINPGALEAVGDGFDNDCDPGTPDVPLVVDGTVIITANLHTVGGGSHPGSTKEGLVLPVRLYDRAGSCLAGVPMTWHNYENVYENCPTIVPLIGETQAGDGTATFSVTPATYVAIGKYDTGGPDGYLYPGVSVGGVESGETTSKFLQLIVNSNDKVVPAKYKKKTGSELLIIEPEYVEWEGETALYPFVFDSVGDWSVTTTVSPPEGFVSDEDNLSEEVNSEVEAVQFTITDVGSDWVPTGVTYALTHKGKKEKVKSHVGVKLSKELAKAKGLTRLGKKLKKEK
jgi:hypothetical protein